MLPGKKYTSQEIVRLLIRRKWLVILPFVVGVAGGISAYRVIPEQYRSETLIMVVPQRVPDAYVRSTVTTPVEDRLASMNDQILSRSRLERIIKDLDLYREDRATGIMEDVVQRMRRDIDARVLVGEESFRVSYLGSDPKTTQKVTERLASLYIEENLRDRENLAESTDQFLESQLEDAKRRLIEHEKKLEVYRRAHAGELPSQLQTNLQAIQNAQLQLQALNETQHRASERRLLVERQLAEAQSLPPALVQAGSAIATPDGPVLLTTAQQLDAARARLEAAKSRYTPDHPDVKALQRAVGELEAKLREEGRQPAAAAKSDVQLSPAEVARQQRVRDLEAQLEVIDHQISTTRAEETRLKAVMAGYQAKIDVLPSRESDLVELTRDYTTLQETYASLLGKREESKLAANLERRQIGEQFKVLDPASLPEKPHNQKQRLGIPLGIGLGGLMLGLAFVALLEYRDSSLKSEADVLSTLNVPVLALVPNIVPATGANRGRRARRLAMAAMVLLLMVGCAAAVLVVWRLNA